MKATGIVRRIDDLGRVVLPKDLRRALNLNEGDPMEIFTQENGQIVLRKYDPLASCALCGAEDRVPIDTLPNGKRVCSPCIDMIAGVRR